MANTEGIESYCRNCVSRDFVMGRGLVCNVREHYRTLKMLVKIFKKMKNWKR